MVLDLLLLVGLYSIVGGEGSGASSSGGSMSLQGGAGGSISILSVMNFWMGIKSISSW